MGKDSLRWHTKYTGTGEQACVRGLQRLGWGVGMEGVSQAWTGFRAGENPGGTVMDTLQPAGNFWDPFFDVFRAQPGEKITRRL